MIGNINPTMREAMRLMQSGDLKGATAAIQQGLQSDTGTRTSARAAGSWRGAPIEGEYRIAPEPDGVGPEVAVGGASRPPGRRGDEGSEFREHRFVGAAGTLDYKLFVPDGFGDGPFPLIVMLHGCSQSPDDFARGTRMNDVAQAHGYVVAYPAQPPQRNAGKCWNWFRSEDQRRGRGEAALIAEFTRDLVRSRGLDERRVYVAGLSAGGAMAAVLANTHPEIYAAFGVHSGLPFGAAHDLPSALAAMKQGGRGTPAATSTPVPSIVFHGDRDTTVDPCNGDGVIAQATRTSRASGPIDDVASPPAVERGTVAGGRAYTKSIFSNAAGAVVAEQWIVHGAGHAWSGGDRSGSYTDPSGPDASIQMVRFFSGYRRDAIN